MKKTKMILMPGILSLSLLAGGCLKDGAEAGNTAPGPDGLYTMECEIVCGGADDELIYGGKISRLGGGCWEIALESPETVKGLVISMDSDGMTAALGDLNFHLETEKIPNKAAFIKVFGILDDAAAADDLRFAETETGLCRYGDYGGEEYVLTYDKATNTLSEIGSGNITVSVGEFSHTDGAETGVRE